MDHVRTSQGFSGLFSDEIVIHGSLVHQHYAGEITVKKLGFDIDIFDDDGKSCRLGEAGELVVKKPFPSAAVRLWNDPEYSRYHAAYYEKFPGTVATMGPTYG